MVGIMGRLLLIMTIRSLLSFVLFGFFFFFLMPCKKQMTAPHKLIDIITNVTF